MAMAKLYELIEESILGTSFIIEYDKSKYRYFLGYKNLPVFSLMMIYVQDFNVKVWKSIID